MYEKCGKIYKYLENLYASFYKFLKTSENMITYTCMKIIERILNLERIVRFGKKLILNIRIFKKIYEYVLVILNCYFTKRSVFLLFYSINKPIY